MRNNILSIGTGSIAKRHVENIFKIDKNNKIDVLSQNSRRSKTFCKKFEKFKIKPIKYCDIDNKNYSHIVIASNTLSHNKYIKFFAKKKKIYIVKNPYHQTNISTFLNHFQK